MDAGARGGGNGLLAGGLGFVDCLKRDITSYLDHRIEEDQLFEQIEQSGLLCYKRPADSEEDRWREARGGRSPLRRGRGRAADCAAAESEAARRCPARRAPPCFGAPPSGALLRWPRRPSPPPRREGPAAGSAGALGAAPCGRASLASCAEPSDSGGESVDSGEDSPSALGSRPSSRRAGPAGAASPKAGSTSPKRGSCAVLLAEDADEVDPDSLLEFTSCYESSNLRWAVYVPEHDAYDLYLEKDLNTRGHVQWFYFAVRNGRPGATVRLRIVNMSKAKSLYREGMQPVAWSEAAAEQACHAAAGEEADPLWAGVSGRVSQLWQPTGDGVRYHRTRPDRNGCQRPGYTLEFDFTFGPWEDDCVFVAMCVPFTYTMLRASLAAVLREPSLRQLCRTKALCKTLGGLRCELLEISNWSVSRRDKRTVVISSRVHPGETNASWMAHGLIGFLLSPTAEAEVLRDNFVFQIVPMLNPDGVVCGNYRCGLCGVDLNRQWQHPSKALHGTVYALKKMIRKSKKNGRLCLYVDLHGHSRKKGIFSYACGRFPSDDFRRFTVRMYPKLLGLLIPEFEASSCRWSTGKGKRGTGRVVVAKDVGLVETYTVEVSFFGAPAPTPAAGAAVAPGGRRPPSARPPSAPQSPVGRRPGSCRPPSACPPSAPRSPVGRKAAADAGGPPPADAAEPGAVEVQEVVPFTAGKLEEFGAGLARALLPHHGLGAEVERRLRRGSAPTGRPSAGADARWLEAAEEDDEDDEEAAGAPAEEERQAEGAGADSESGSSCWGSDRASDDEAGSEDGASDAGDSEGRGGRCCPPADAAAAGPARAGGGRPRPPAGEAGSASPSPSGPSPCPADGGVGGGLHPPLWATEAHAPRPSILGIDASEVLREMQAEVPAPDHSDPDESPGSDSAPSEDNLQHAELVRVAAALRHKHGQRRRSTRSRAGNRPGPHGGPDGGGRGDAGRQRTRHRSQSSPAGRRRGNPDRAATTPTVPPGSPTSPSRRNELLKSVAFGQTTYVSRSCTAASARPASGHNASGRATLSGPSPGAGGWSSAPQHGVNGSAAAAAAFVLLGPQKDRFSCGPPAGVGAPKEDGHRRRPPSFGSRGGEDASAASLSRRLYMRNVSSSVLQLQRCPVQVFEPPALPSAGQGSDAASAGGAAQQRALHRGAPPGSAGRGPERGAAPPSPRSVQEHAPERSAESDGRLSTRSCPAPPTLSYVTLQEY